MLSEKNNTTTSEDKENTNQDKQNNTKKEEEEEKKRKRISTVNRTQTWLFLIASVSFLIYVYTVKTLSEIKQILIKINKFINPIYRYILPSILILVSLVIIWFLVIQSFIKSSDGKVIDTERATYALCIGGFILFLGIFLFYFAPKKTLKWKKIFKYEEDKNEIKNQKSKVKSLKEASCREIVNKYIGSLHSRFEDEVQQLLKDAHNAQLAAYLSFCIGFLIFCVLIFKDIPVVEGEHLSISIMKLIFPKTALIIIMTVIIRTFMNQYRHSIVTVKYMQNELNTIEQKLVFYLLMEDKLKVNDINELVKGIVNIERNFILQQNQNTISTKLQSEIQKDERENIVPIIDSIKNLSSHLKEQIKK